MIGFFVNTLVLRLDLSGNPKFNELLRRVREVTVGAYAHQDLPFEKLVEVLQPERSLNRQSLFQVLFGLHNYPTDTLDIYGMEAQSAGAGGRPESRAGALTPADMEVESALSKFDLALSMSDLGEQGLKAHMEYSADLFTAATVGQMLTHFETILRSVAANPDTRVNALRVFSGAAQTAPARTRKEEEELFLKLLKGRRDFAGNPEKE